MAKDLDNIEAARMTLLMDRERYPDFSFFSAVSQMTPIRKIPGMRFPAMTNGLEIMYDPEAIAKMTPDEVFFVYLHELLHICLGHCTRIIGVDRALGNIAVDLAANDMLATSELGSYSGFLMEDAIYPGRGRFADFPSKLSAEEYWNLLMKLSPTQRKELKEAFGDKRLDIEVVNMTGAKKIQAGNCVRERVQAGVAAYKKYFGERGSSSSVVDRFVPKVKAVLARDVLPAFISQGIGGSIDDWRRPNKRFPDIYLPSSRSEGLGEIVISIDTSGSIGSADLGWFAKMTMNILSGHDVTLHLLVCDAAIRQEFHFELSERNDSFNFPDNLKGGGGTSHVPVFNWVREHSPHAKAVICMTDMATEFPENAPPMPVLWVTNSSMNSGVRQPPFGILSVFNN